MHLVDGPGHDSNQFTEGDPIGGVEATTVTAEIANAWMLEIANVITLGAGLPLNEPGNPQLLQAIQAIGGNAAASGIESLIVNGDFRFTQGPLGVSENLSDESASIFDGFFNYTGTTGTATVSRQQFIVGAGDVPREPRYYMRHQQTGSAGAAQPYIITGHDDVRAWAGEEITFAVNLRVASGTLNVTPSVSQNFGLGGSPSASVDQVGSDWVVGTNWTLFEFTVTLDDLDTKNIGNEADHIAFQMTLPSGTTFTLDVADMRVVRGPNAGTFRRLNWQEELQRVRRYRESSVPSFREFLYADVAPEATDGYYNILFDPGWQTGSFAGEWIPVWIPFAVPKSLKSTDRSGTARRPKIYTAKALTLDDIGWSPTGPTNVEHEPDDTIATERGIHQVGYNNLGGSDPPTSGNPRRVNFKWLADATPDWGNI